MRVAEEKPTGNTLLSSAKWLIRVLASTWIEALEEAVPPFGRYRSAQRQLAATQKREELLDNLRTLLANVPPAPFPAPLEDSLLCSEDLIVQAQRAARRQQGRNGYVWGEAKTALDNLAQVVKDGSAQRRRLPLTAFDGLSSARISRTYRSLTHYGENCPGCYAHDRVVSGTEEDFSYYERELKNLRSTCGSHADLYAAERHEWTGRLYLHQNKQSHRTAALHLLCRRQEREVSMDCEVTPKRLNRRAIERLLLRTAVLIVAPKTLSHIQDSLAKVGLACPGVFDPDWPVPSLHMRVNYEQEYNADAQILLLVRGSRVAEVIGLWLIGSKGYFSLSEHLRERCDQASPTIEIAKE